MNKFLLNPTSCEQALDEAIHWVWGSWKVAPWLLLLAGPVAIMIWAGYGCFLLVNAGFGVATAV